MTTINTWSKYTEELAARDNWMQAVNFIGVITLL